MHHEAGLGNKRAGGLRSALFPAKSPFSALVQKHHQILNVDLHQAVTVFDTVVFSNRQKLKINVKK